MGYALSLGILTYLFVLYSFGLGAANQQLVVYAVPSAAILSAVAWDIRRDQRLPVPPVGRERARRSAFVAGSTAVVVAIGLGLSSWVSNWGFDGNDSANAKVAAFVTQNVPACATVNETGDQIRWASTLPANPVTKFRNGPLGLAHGVHVWLVSPKDATLRYGSSPALEQWVRSNGREVFSAPSTSYQSLRVWYVGTPTTPAGATAPRCANAIAPASTHASLGIFSMLLAESLIAVGLLGAGAAVVLRRRRVRHDTGPSASS